MVWVKFSSIYTERDRFGNTRTLENSFEASGQADEIIRILDTVLKVNKLPGTTPINSLNSVNKFLIGYNDEED